MRPPAAPPRLSLTIAPAEFVAMTNEQQRAAIDAVRALLLPQIRDETTTARHAA